MAFSKSLLVSLLFAVLLVSSEVVSAHRLLAETTATQNANTDGFHGNGHGGQGGHGGHGGQSEHGGHGANANTDGFHGNDHGHGGHGNGGHGGRGGHGATAQETETEN